MKILPRPVPPAPSAEAILATLIPAPDMGQLSQVTRDNMKHLIEHIRAIPALTGEQAAQLLEQSLGGLAG